MMTGSFWYFLDGRRPFHLLLSITSTVIRFADTRLGHERTLLGHSAKSYKGQKRIFVNLGLLLYSGPPEQQLEFGSWSGFYEKLSIWATNIFAGSTKPFVAALTPATYGKHIAALLEECIPALWRKLFLPKLHHTNNTAFPEARGRIALSVLPARW